MKGRFDKFLICLSLFSMGCSTYEGVTPEDCHVEYDDLKSRYNDLEVRVNTCSRKLEECMADHEYLEDSAAWQQKEAHKRYQVRSIFEAKLKILSRIDEDDFDPNASGFSYLVYNYPEVIDDAIIEALIAKGKFKRDSTIIRAALNNKNLRPETVLAIFSDRIVSPIETGDDIGTLDNATVAAHLGQLEGMTDSWVNALLSIRESVLTYNETIAKQKQEILKKLDPKNQTILGKIQDFFASEEAVTTENLPMDFKTAHYRTGDFGNPVRILNNPLPEGGEGTLDRRRR